MLCRKGSVSAGQGRRFCGKADRYGSRMARLTAMALRTMPKCPRNSRDLGLCRQVAGKRRPKSRKPCHNGQPCHLNPRANVRGGGCLTAVRFGPRPSPPPTPVPPGPRPARPVPAPRLHRHLASRGGLVRSPTFQTRDEHVWGVQRLSGRVPASRRNRYSCTV